MDMNLEEYFKNLPKDERDEVTAHCHAIKNGVEIAFDSYMRGDGYFALRVNELTKIIACMDDAMFNRFANCMIVTHGREEAGKTLNRLMIFIERAKGSIAINKTDAYATLRRLERLVKGGTISYGRQQDQALYVMLSQ